MPNSAVTILYIDDDPALARLLRRAMARRGHGFETAATGEEGLARIAGGGIDVVALDHYLPTGTGLDVLSRLRDIAGSPPVVYVTGSADTAIAVAALKAGAADYVTKSVGDEFFELFGRAVDQAIETARLQREKERAEREVREARDRAEIMLHEVNHRVANSLALVAGLVRLQANALPDPAAKEALNETQARISAIAGVHRRLYTSHDVRYVEIDDYLSSLAGELEASMQATGHDSAIRLMLEPVRLPTDKAVTLGVIVTELVTNAFKYAYPDGRRGEVRIVLKRLDDASALLSVEDDGVGWTGTGPTRGTGLGTRLVRSMAASLGSEIAYAQDGTGTRARLVLPIDPE